MTQTKEPRNPITIYYATLCTTFLLKPIAKTQQQTTPPETKKPPTQQKKPPITPNNKKPINDKPKMINQKKNKKLNEHFDPKTLKKTKDLKKPYKINIIKINHVYKKKYPYKKIPLDQLISINFQNIKLKNFTKIVTYITKKQFILTQNITNQITIMNPEPITIYKTYKTFLSTLKTNNLTIIKQKKFLHIVPKTKTRTSKTDILKPDQQTPTTNTIMTQLVPIKHILTNKIKKLIQNFASDKTNITIYQPTNTLIITKIKTNIPKLRKLIKQIDHPTKTIRI